MSDKSKAGIALRDGDKNFQVVHEEHKASIVPPPEDLERYENTLPGAAERMFSMAEKQQTHVLAQERKAGDENHSLAARGQWLVALICLCSLAIAAAGVFLDSPNAVYSGVAAVAGILALSLISRKK